MTDPGETVIRPASVDNPRPREASAFARLWARRIAGTAFVPGGQRRTHAVLRGLVDRLVAAVVADPPDTDAGYQVGSDLVAAKVADPEVLGRSLTLLDQRLIAELGIAVPGAADRLRTVLGAMATGFTEALRRRTLAEQDTIRRHELTVRTTIQRALTEAQQQLQHLALYDQLTDLPNRVALIRHLDRLGAVAPHNARVGLCTVSVDRFPALRSSLGPDVADRLLRAVTDRLRALAEGQSRFLAHLGGETFALVLDAVTNPDESIKLADAAVDTLAAGFCIGDRELGITACAGLVERRAAGATPNDLLRAAEMALGWARADRSRYAVFDQERNERDIARYALSAALPAAIERGEFTLVYQPLIRLADNVVEGAEALARWNHPTRGVLGPREFIDLAEDTGLIGRLGTHLLEQACAEAASWRHLTPDPPLLSVNLAVPQLRHPGLAPAVAAILDQTGITPRSLQLEITESAAADDVDNVLNTLTALRELGVRLAIDDFGTGYSSLAYLSELPVHAIKLDARFARHLHDPQSRRPADHTILAHLIGLAHDLGLGITAEGIETPAQQRALAALGCDTGQGFHLGRPMPANDFRQLLTPAGQPVRAGIAGGGAGSG